MYPTSSRQLGPYGSASISIQHPYHTNLCDHGGHYFFFFFSFTVFLILLSETVFTEPAPAHEFFLSVLIRVVPAQLHAHPFQKLGAEMMDQ